MEKKQIEGELKEITHKYLQDKFNTSFQNSFIRIKDKEDGKVKSGNLFGLVPESLLGKEVILKQTYNKETTDLFQCLSYNIGGLNYNIDYYGSNHSEQFREEK